MFPELELISSISVCLARNTQYFDNSQEKQTIVQEGIRQKRFYPVKPCEVYNMRLHSYMKDMLGSEFSEVNIVDDNVNKQGAGNVKIKVSRRTNNLSRSVSWVVHPEKPPCRWTSANRSKSDSTVGKPVRKNSIDDLAAIDDKETLFSPVTRAYGDGSERRKGGLSQRRLTNHSNLSPSKETKKTSRTSKDPLVAIRKRATASGLPESLRELPYNNS